MKVECVCASYDHNRRKWYTVVYAAVPNRDGIYFWIARGNPIAGPFDCEADADDAGIDYEFKHGIPWMGNDVEGLKVDEMAIVACIGAARRMLSLAGDRRTIRISFCKEGITSISQ